MSLDGVSTIRISVMASVKSGGVEKLCVSLSFADEMLPCDKFPLDTYQSPKVGRPALWKAYKRRTSGIKIE
jgi:hypothetical protein